MNSGTKKLIGAAAVSGLILAAGAAVYAHGGPGFGPGAMMGGWGGQHGMMGGPGGMHGFGGGQGHMWSGDPVAYTDVRLTDLKETLGITAEQEETWNSYVEAVRGRAQLMVAHREIMRNSGGPEMTTDQRIGLMQQGADQMQRIATATADLYAILSAEQKSKADESLGTGFRRGPRHGYGPRWTR
jgi:hypothetical protein